MSIVVRKTGTREYVYAAHRDGRRMVQEYVGPLNRPDVQLRVKMARRAGTVPAHTLRLFAGVDPGSLALPRDAATIIHRVLEQGDVEDLEWLTWVFAANAIVDVLLSARELTPRVRNFWLVWFGVPDAS